MAQGKNKKNYGKKGGAKKKTTDPLSRKEWFQLRAPAPFQPESFGYTCANRTQGLSNILFYFQKKSKTASEVELLLQINLILHQTKMLLLGEKSNLLLIKPEVVTLLPASMVLI
jgi:hypothetical protein